MIRFDVQDAAGTIALGRALAEHLPDGTVIALNGTLGAGKTRLVQAAAEACDIEAGTATSPTFVLINEYHGRRSIYHIDAYRVKDDAEFRALGPDEYFAGRGLTFVEWAERVAGCLPAERLEIEIDVLGDSARRFTARALGDSLAAPLKAIGAELSSRGYSTTKNQPGG